MLNLKEFALFPRAVRDVVGGDGVGGDGGS